MRKSSLLVLSLLASVAACSGGGGGSPSGGAITSTGAVVAAPTFDAKDGGTGTATVSSYSFGSANAVDCCTSVNSSGASTVVMKTDANGAPLTLQLNFSNEGGPGINHTYDIANDNPAQVPFGGNAFATTDTTGGSTYNLIYAGASEPTLDVNNNPRIQSLNYTTYGQWSVANADNSGSTGVFAAGQETAPGTAYPMPIATYSGGAIGSSFDSGTGIASQLTGSSTVTANFGTGAVNGSLALTNANTGNPFDTVNLNGNIIGANGNKFNGATSGTTIAGATGKFAGSFFGPAYNEMGGTWNLSNVATGGTVTALGAFGGARPLH